MEKGTSGKVLTVVLTGPECTGKSTLAEQLARHYNTISIPEYARKYIGNLSRPYHYDDVVHIAEMQVKQLGEKLPFANKIIFLDTYLIITKVWFDLVFQKRPDWMSPMLLNHTIDLYLLCHTDIPWIADDVRENGGERRQFLYDMYLQELHEFGCNYGIVKGTGASRLQNAINWIDPLLKNLPY